MCVPPIQQKTSLNSHDIALALLVALDAAMNEIERRAGFEEMAAEASHAVERLAVVRVDDECQKACLRIELLESKHDNLVVALFVTAEIVAAVQDRLIVGLHLMLCEREWCQLN